MITYYFYIDSNCVVCFLPYHQWPKDALQTILHRQAADSPEHAKDLAKVFQCFVDGTLLILNENARKLIN